MNLNWRRASYETHFIWMLILHKSHNLNHNMSVKLNNLSNFELCQQTHNIYTYTVDRRVLFNFDCKHDTCD